MKFKVAVVLLLARGALGITMKVATSSKLTFDLESAKNRPVSKVVTLLKDMLMQLEKEGEEDKAAYKKMACWCKTNDQEKTKSIEDATAKVDELASTVEELTATSARLTTEIGDLKLEVSESQGGLDKATALRQKQLKEFSVDEADLLGSISSLKGAVTTLKKHNPSASLLQVSARAGHVQVDDAVKYAMSLMSEDQKRKMKSFVQGGPESYASQSGEVFGILRQMRETFETNLASSQKEEKSNQLNYEGLKAAKDEQIGASRGQLAEKEQQLAETDEKNAQAKDDRKDTKKALAADQAFVVTMEETCTMTDRDWESRQQTRNEEMEAVSKAVSILSSDDAHELFSKTLQFVQRESAVHSERREKASQLLSAAAEQSANPSLVVLAARVKLDAFTKVKKAIDEMASQLAQEQADEVKHKDYCASEFGINEVQTQKKTQKKTDVAAKIADLKSNVKTLTEAIDKLEKEVLEDQKQLKEAGENRAKENQEYQMTIADQQATQKLLSKALLILKGFYSAKKKTALVDLWRKHQAAPAGFKAYGKSSAAGGALGLIQNIIDDAKAMETKATKEEEAAVNAYNKLSKETNAAIAEKRKSIVNKSGSKATAESDLVQANENMDNTVLELEQLANALTELHASCDFVVKNFETRQAARGEEIEALKQAKAILSGAKFAAFLQRN